MKELDTSVQDNSSAVKGGKSGSSKKLVTIIILSVCLAMLCAGLTLIFMLNFNRTIPGKVTFFDVGDHIYVQAQTNDNFNGYRFSFKNVDDQSTSFTVDSQECIVDLTSVEQLKPNVKYKVSVCYLGDIDGGNSEYSKEVDWISYTYLATPELQDNDSSISWEEVPDAGAYVIYSPTNLFDSITVTENYINKNRLPAGKYTIQVVAISLSNPDQYKQSLRSSSLEIEVFQTFNPFTSIEFHAGVNDIVITSNNKVDVIEILLDQTKYTVKKFNVEHADFYTYTINISALGLNPAVVGARPYSNNPYISSQFIYSNQA